MSLYQGFALIMSLVAIIEVETMSLYQALALILSSLFSLVAIIVSLFNHFTTRRINLYQDIDRLYLEVLKIAIEHPEFVDPQRTKAYKESFKDDNLSKYESYAFLVWNVCETIADRRDDTALFSTWKPVLKTESERHRAWFDRPENKDKFKEDFRTFIQKSYPQRSLPKTA